MTALTPYFALFLLSIVNAKPLIELQATDEGHPVNSSIKLDESNILYKPSTTMETEEAQELTTDLTFLKEEFRRSRREDETYENEIVLDGNSLFDSFDDSTNEKIIFELLLHNFLSITDKMNVFLDLLISKFDDASIKTIKNQLTAMKETLK